MHLDFLEEVKDMKRFKNILFAVETGEACKSALERAITLAEINQANLTVVDVIERVTADSKILKKDTIDADLQTAMVGASEQTLEALIDPYRKRIKIRTKVLTGTPFLQIICEVLRNGHDLVIKIPETQNWMDRLFGCSDMNLLRHCPCPVLIIKPTALISFHLILAPVDLDGTYPPDELNSRQALNQQIFELASSLAISDSAELHFVQVWHAYGESMMRGALLHTPEEEIIAYVEQQKRQPSANLDAFMGEVAIRLGQETMDYLKPQAYLVKGSPRKEIPALAKRIKADLVVMGSVGRTGIPGFIMGNTAEMILNQIDCSVLVIKPPGFATLVTVESTQNREWH
jgi:nucleotide-binding universal stress UspA family protein